MDNALPRQARTDAEPLPVLARLAWLQELGAIDGVTDLPSLAGWLELSPATVRKLSSRGIKRRTALRIVAGLQKQGIVAHLDWVLSSIGAKPQRTQGVVTPPPSTQQGALGAWIMG